MRRSALLPAIPLVILLAGCGGSGKSGQRATQAPPAAGSVTQPAPTRTFKTTAPSSPSALQAEANAAAAGDIPDNQIFVVFHDPTARYSIKYPEGWAQKGAGRAVTFRDKNNIVRIVVAPGRFPSVTVIRQQLAAQQGARIQSPPRALTIAGARAVKVVYTTESAPNAVTGKRVTLVVDRYYLSEASKTAIVDLGTPQGVDNVDAYRLMIESFRWR